MPAGFIQLAASGPINLYLTGNPQMTFFIAVYKRHINFAIEQVRQYFYGNLNFGQKIYCPIQPVGDLINQMYVYIELPCLNCEPEKNPDYFVSYVNSIGNAIIRTVDVEIGGEIIDRHYGQWLEIWSEFNIPDDKRYA